MARQEIDVKNQDQKQSVRIKDSHSVTIYQTEKQTLKIVQILQTIHNLCHPEKKSGKENCKILKTI